MFCRFAPWCARVVGFTPVLWRLDLRTPTIRFWRFGGRWPRGVGGFDRRFNQGWLRRSGRRGGRGLRVRPRSEAAADHFHHAAAQLVGHFERPETGDGAGGVEV